MSYVLASIVEGHGEVDAVPVLLRRLHPTLSVSRPVRVKRQRIINPTEIDKYARMVEANIRQGEGRGGVLVVLDADNQCAAELGPRLQEQFARALGNRIVRVVFAVREFESWLVAGDDACTEVADEARGGKAWLAQRLGRYSPTADQPRLCAQLDLSRAERTSRSFRRMLKAISELAADAAS
ncbi:MAG: DUF4276 family protein [Phycisphaerales bacterium]|nr:DUF4276 family protein [Phycisphaerales bacterium]